MKNSSIITSSYRRVILPHIVITLCVVAVATLSPGLSGFKKEIIGGSLISLINFMLVCWALKNIFLKKLFALSVTLIVFKWPILGLVLYHLVVNLKYDGLWLVVGLSSLIPSILSLIIMKPNTKTG